MTSNISAPPELTQRRQMLRSNRRIKLLQSLWQTLAVGSMFGGLVWVTTKPIWVLQESQQIAIEGNQMLSQQVIQSLLPISYPQSLLRLEPEAIAQALETRAPIAEVTVTRYLFPPSVTVQVKERVPVAIALSDLPPGNVVSTSNASMGLLDEKGGWIPIQTYNANVRRELKLPHLKIIGAPEQYRSYWAHLYQAVTHSTVKVNEINCQNPANVILKTELGDVHLGSYGPQLTEQFRVLAQMRKLPTKVHPSSIAYIDLKDPQNPTVQMNQSEDVLKPATL